MFHDTITGFQANICINYGGRDEIHPRRAALCRRLREWRKKAGGIDSGADFAHYLYTDGMPDPELIIRPSGGAAHVEFPALAVGVCGVLFHGCALARF